MRFKMGYTQETPGQFAAAPDWLALPSGLQWVYLNWGMHANRQAAADYHWQTYVEGLS